MADPSVTRSTRTYILATLVATLAATALIAMFLVIFSPAQVTFSVTSASCSHWSKDDSTVSLHLSIFANSSQRRTEVSFESIFVDLFNSSDFLGREDDWRRRINAHVDGAPQGYLKYPGNTSINVSAAAPSRVFADFAPDWRYDDVTLTVTVMAQVHFKVGVVRTRLYGITVYCDDVPFPVVPRNNNSSPSSRPTKYMKQEEEPIPDAPQLPVTCHG